MENIKLTVTKDTACGFCGLTLYEIQEPRALPCGHTQCTECIHVNYQNKEIECKICRETFKDIDIRALPTIPEHLVQEALTDTELGLPSAGRECNRCADERVKAVVCCADCKKRFCHQHAEEHLFHCGDHVLLPIEDNLTPERYEVERCKTHKKHVLEEICKNCMKQFCKRCDSKVSCSALNQRSDSAAGLNQGMCHEVVLLKDVTEEMREKLRKLSQNIFDKIKRCRDIEKSSWRRLAEQETHIDNIYNQIDQMAEDLIQQIRREAEDLKTEFREQLNQSTEKVGEFSEEMLLNTTVLDDLYIYGTHLADRRADQQLLEEFDEVSSNLTQTNDNLEYETKVSLKTPYLNTGPPSMNLNGVFGCLPTAITRSKQEETAAVCYRVSWTHDDRILCATRAGLEIRDNVDLKLQEQLPDDNLVCFSATLCGSKLFIKAESPESDKHITFSGSLEQPTRSILHSEEEAGPSHLSANKTHVAIIDTVNKMLKFFSTINEEHQFDIQLPEGKRPYGVHLTSDAALVTFPEEGKLCKYALSPSPDPIWTCDGLEFPSGVTTDESGFIYVGSLDDSKINILSPDGEKIRELTHEKLQECIDEGSGIYDIAVRDGKMVLACLDEGVMLFNMS